MKTRKIRNSLCLFAVFACVAVLCCLVQHYHAAVFNAANAATEERNCVVCNKTLVSQGSSLSVNYCSACQTIITGQQTVPNETTASLCKLHGTQGEHGCILSNATLASWNNYGKFTDTQYSETMNYRVFLPYKYDPSKEYPMVIYMHGLGFESKDINEIGINSLLTQALTQTKLEIICVIPQCLPNRYWPVNPYTTEIAFHLFEELQRHLSVDKSRIYVSGHSYGAMGTLLLLENHPNYFAGAMIAAGAATSYTNYKNIATTPLWMFCGDQDAGFAAKLNNLYNQLVALNADVQYTVWPGKDHGTFSYSAQNSEVTKWLLAQKLD